MPPSQIVRRSAVLIAGLLLLAAPGAAGDRLVEKRVFSMPSYTTEGGQAINGVRVGWEAYGTLNAARDNVILVTHFFSGTSHAAGRYAPEDAAPGYWDSIIGAGKPIDTDRFYVVSSDTLVNLNVKDPRVTTTGPATIDPATGRPYGMRFPIVGIRDFVNVQKALLASLGITRLYAVAGASMGALQAYEWAISYPALVERIIPVIGEPESDAFTIGWMSLWGAPIRLDPKWNGGDYYGRAEPVDGLAAALRLITQHARHDRWAQKTYGRRWAAAGRDPGKSWDSVYAYEEALSQIAATRVRSSDANSFLYLCKAIQLFGEGHGALAEALRGVRARALIVSSKTDLIFDPEYSERAAVLLGRAGQPAVHVTIEGDMGHAEGVVGIAAAGEAIRRFLSE